MAALVGSAIGSIGSAIGSAIGGSNPPIGIGIGASEDAEPSLPPLDVYNTELSKLLYKDAQTCEQKLWEFRMELKALREESKSFNYAMPLVDTDDDVREEFFSSLVLIIERQPDDVTRRRVISLLIELAAIECRRPSGGIGTSRGGSNENDLSFGYHALRTLRDLMPAVVDARRLFVDCVEDVFNQVWGKASNTHYCEVLPLLLDIIRDSAFGRELYDKLSPLAVTFCAFLTTLLRKVSLADGNLDPESSAFIPSLHHVMEIIAICCKNSRMAAYEYYASTTIPTIYSYYRIYDKLEQPNEEKYPSDQIFSIYRMIGAMSRSCPQIASIFSGPVPDLPNAEDLLTILLARWRSLPDSPGRIQQGDTPQLLASSLFCLTGILSTSKVACQRMKSKKEGVQASRDYSIRLLQVAESFDHADMIAAALDALNALIHNEELHAFKVAMENRPFGAPLQSIIRKLLTTTRPQRGHKEALISALKIMTYYNSVPKISKQLDDMPKTGYDRESILFRILAAKQHPYLDDDVKYAAANCLSTVSLTEFDKTEIRNLVTIFMTLPTFMSAKLYGAMSRLVYLLFKMAIDGYEADAMEEIKTTDDVPLHQCGETFRTVYATEVVSALYEIVNKTLIVGDEAPLKSEDAKIRFELACVKFLMTAWIHKEFRARAEDRAPVQILVKSLKAEQHILRWLKKRHDRLISEQKCVDCEEKLVKQKTRRRFDHLVVRCPGCIDKQSKGRSFINQTYTPLFLEQTWSAFSIKPMFQALSQIRDVDAVAFRCMHQIANVLESYTQEESAQRLIKHRTFEEWNADLPGREMFHCRAIEYEEWEHRVKQIRSRKLGAGLVITNARVPDAALLAEIQLQYWEDVYREKNTTATLQQRVAQWELLLLESDRDDRVVNLVIKDTINHQILAFCGGGPLRDNEVAIEGEFNAELYGICVRSGLSDADQVQVQLLTEFSSQMSRKGFERCYAWVHKNERVVFSPATWINDSILNAENPEVAVTNAKQFLYKWELSENVWQSCRAHIDFIDDDGVNKVVEFVVRGDPNFEKNNTFRSTIRIKMEEFGGVLAEQFHKEEDHNKQNLMVGVSSGELDVGTMGIEFQRLIESAFKKTRPTLNVPPKPVWDAYLLGTDEEVFMQNITRFPSLNPNIDPDPDDDPYDDPMPDDEDLEDPNQKGGKTPNADSRRATSFSALRELKRNTYESSRRITMETASSALMATAQLQAAQLSPSHKIVPPSVTGVGNQGTVSTQLDDIHEDGIIRPENQETVSLLSHVRAANTSDAILEEQLTSVCVAMMRGFYVLLTDSSHKIRAECCKVLKNYETFAKLRALMLSCDYGIRKSILEPYIDENQLCVKFLQLMEELIEVEEPGTESSLRALELYEVFVCILSDVFARILQLLRSRNENTRDPLHSIRFLTREEERILCAASRCAALVIQAITQITFFPGTTSWIARGNRECRKKALMEFFVSSSVFAEGLKHLILYDLEASADLSYDSDDGVYVYMTPRPYRDEMRIAMHQIIGQLFIVEPAYKAEFIQRHQTSLVKANSSIRPSALHAIFAAEASLFFRDKLDEHLHGRGILSADELIVSHAFVDYGISKRSLSGGYRLLVITNRAYYVSHDNYDDLDAAIEWKSQYVDQYSHLQKREFADMQLIFRGLGDQIFAICRHSQPRAKRLSSETMPQELDVFVHPRLGVVDQLIRALSRAHRDDQNRTLPVVDETFTNESLKYLYRQFKLPNARANVYREHLYTHVLVRRSGSDYRQVLVWAHSDANDFIITSAYNIKLWDMQLNPSSFQTQDGISLLRARRGKRSDYAAYYSSGHVYDLSKIESVDFTENTDTHMILIFPGRSLHVCFQCDTARELWRREIKKYLFGKDDSPWKASILPANEALTAGQAVRLL